MGSPLAFLPILMMLVGAMGVGALLLGLNYVLGRKVWTKRKLSPYESGMPLLDALRILCKLAQQRIISFR